MRKTIIMLFMAVPLATFAQLKVKSNGKVCIGTSAPMESTYLSVGRFVESKTCPHDSLRLFSHTKQDGFGKL